MPPNTQAIAPYLLTFIVRVPFFALAALSGISTYILLKASGLSELEYEKVFYIERCLLFTVIISSITLGISSHVFYAEVLKRYKNRFQLGARAFRIAPWPEFYPNITSPLTGVVRKISGYIFAVSYLIWPLSLAALLVFACYFGF